MAEQITYLIIGNGIAGITAAEVLRAEDATASIGIVADDSFPVYYRPALKDYLGGKVPEEKLWARPSNFYKEQKILFLPERAISIQAEQHTVQLQSNKQISYQKLLLATGARAARLTCPGMELNGVFTLRSVADYQAIMERLPAVRRAVVCGSGTLALETIETLRQRNMQVSHLIRRNTVWSEVLDETASDLVLQQEIRDEVDVHLEEEIAEIQGEQGEVTGVITNKGTRIACEIVLVAIGIEPNIDYARQSSISCWRGIHVDSQMRTSLTDIYAAGDVIETVDKPTQRTRVIGQWYPAIQQARAAAYSMLNVLDFQRPFHTNTFYNATNLYGLPFASVGNTNTKGFQELVADPKPRNYRKILLKDGIPVGMLSLGDRRQVLALKRAIDHQVSLVPVLSQIFADNFNLSEWLDQQGVPPPLLGANRVSTTADTAKKAISIQTNKPSIEKIVEDAMFAAPNPSEPTEAFLVHLADQGLRLPEIVISQNDTTLVGRQAGVHVLIDEPTVSRHHAEISYANGHYVVYDLGSSNGTFVNEVRIKSKNPHILKQNDEIRFGTNVTFRFLQRSLQPARQIKPPIREIADPLAETQLRPKEEARPVVQGRQPVLKADGSLLPPGANNALPAAVVNTFKEVPALIVLSESGAARSPQVHLLKAGKQTTIGREKDNTIELADIVVSRHHAEIMPSSDGFYIRDMGSSNGLVINQRKLDVQTAQRLQHGDQIMLGSTIILFVDLQAGREKTEELLLPLKEAMLSARTRRKNIQEQTGPLKMAIPVPNPGSKVKMVICSHCGVANMEVARFCAGCSELLGHAS